MFDVRGGQFCVLVNGEQLVEARWNTSCSWKNYRGQDS